MRFQPRRVALALAFLLATTAGCSSGDDSPTSAARTVPTSSAPATTLVETAHVVLDDPGAEPRQVLVLRLAAGTRTQVVFSTRTGLDMTINGDDLPTGVLPGTSVVFDEVLDRVDADGTVHYSVTFKDVKVEAGPGTDPDVVSQAEATLGQMEGLTGSGTFDAHGGSQTLTLDTSSITDSTLSSSMDSMSSQIGNLAAPFPAEPVGAGARWTTTATANLNGIRMTTTTHYTLVSRTGDRYALEFTQEAEAPPGPADFPNLPTGTRASITRFTVESSGQTAGDLTRHLPLTSAVTGSGDGTFTVGVGSEEAILVEHLTIDSSLSPV